MTLVPHKTTIFWDIDGTLIDSAGSGGGALLLALKQEFLVSSPVSVALHGRTDLGIFSDLLVANGLVASETNLRKLTQSYFERLPATLHQRSGRILPGVVELLDLLDSDERCVQSIATGNMPRSALHKLAHYKIAGYFRHGVFGHEALGRLDLAQPLLAAAESLTETAQHAPSTEQHVASIELNFQPSNSIPPREATALTSRDDIVIIGDTPLDIALAKCVGARSIAVGTGGYQLEQLVESGADLVVEDLQATEKLKDFILPASS